MIFVVFCFLLFWFQPSVTNKVGSALTTIPGTIVGFYFGGKKSDGFRLPSQFEKSLHFSSMSAISFTSAKPPTISMRAVILCRSGNWTSPMQRVFELLLAEPRRAEALPVDGIAKPTISSAARVSASRERFNKMIVHLEQHRMLITVFAAIVLLMLIVMSRPAFRQPSDTVVIRLPGGRFLGPQQSAQPEAATDSDFALLSLAAYGDIKKDKPDKETPCIDAKGVLEGEGWHLWPTFPDAGLQWKMDAVHLRAQVWTNRSKNIVAVAFGGTVFSNHSCPKQRLI